MQSAAVFRVLEIFLDRSYCVDRCGARSVAELAEGTTLAKLGYSTHHVFKF